MQAVQPQVKLMFLAPVKERLWIMALNAITVVALGALFICAVHVLNVLNRRDRERVAQKMLAVSLDGKPLPPPPKLIEAIENGELQKVKSLISCNPTSIHEEYDGWNPIHFAIKGGHVEIYSLLLEKDAKCSPTKQGERPLDLAARFNHPELV